MTTRAGMDRREFLKLAGGSAVLGLAGPQLLKADSLKGRATACIMIWLGGGAAQVDTWDPKRKGDPAKQVAGSAYDAIATAVEGVQVCEHLPRVAARMDRMTLVRTVYHDVIDEHSAAVNRMHTGRPVSGTVVYPSIGAVINHELGAGAKGVPGYVLCGYPSNSRGAGFLGSRYGYLYVTETSKGPEGLSRPPGIDVARQERRSRLLSRVRQGQAARFEEGDPLLEYDSVIDESLELAGGSFTKAFQLENESPSLRKSYGSEFGQRCLLARRLVERGTRFVEVMHNLNFTNGTGWDTHKDGQEKQHELIRDLDQSLSVLLDDLERNRLLDKTLVVVASEFGRPAAFDGAGGRGHQSSTFSVALAGGGLKHSGVYGETDELAKKPVTPGVSIPDLHATIYQALGVDPSKELYDGDRPVPITDRGVPIRALFG